VTDVKPPTSRLYAANVPTPPLPTRRTLALPDMLLIVSRDSGVKWVFGQSRKMELMVENECRKNGKDFMYPCTISFLLADLATKSGMSCIWLWLVKCCQSHPRSDWTSLGLGQ
jgi:hypothetical protein